MSGVDDRLLKFWIKAVREDPLNPELTKGFWEDHVHEEPDFMKLTLTASRMSYNDDDHPQINTFSSHPKIRLSQVKIPIFVSLIEWKANIPLSIFD